MIFHREVENMVGNSKEMELAATIIHEQVDWKCTRNGKNAKNIE